MPRTTVRLAGIAALMAVLALAACSNDTADAEQDGENGRIALAMSHMSNSFTNTVAEAAREKGRELGYEVVVFDGNKDASTQVGQIESAVAQGFDGILVEPVSTDGVLPGLNAANEAGVPIATIVQRATDQSLAIAYIGGDEVTAGKLQMEKALEAIGGSGEIALLYGPMGSDAQLARKEGYDQALQAHPEVTIAFDQTGNWVTAEALNLVENWLSTGRDIKAVVAQNDAMAVGAVQAIANAGKSGEILAFGVDATEEGVAAIKDGTLAGTVSQDTAGVGRLGVETMVKHLQGETVPSEVLTEAVWITQENVDTLPE